MKKYFNVIKICSLLLLLFPFLGLPIVLEYLYVIILGAIIGLTALYLQYKSGLFTSENSETSLQEYVEELKHRFKQQSETIQTKKEETKSTRISDVSLNKENEA